MLWQSASAEVRHGVVLGVNHNWIFVTMDKRATEPETAEPGPPAARGSAPPANGLASTIKLGPVMDLVAATALKEDILEVIGADNGMEIDAIDVVTITTPCIQVIVAAGLSAEERSQAFSIVNATPNCHAAFEDLGLGAQFGRWTNQNG
jgi:anti-anti-sigma regulatory factor